MTIDLEGLVLHEYSLTVLRYNPEIKDIRLDAKPTPIIEKIVSKKIELPGISDLQPRRVSWSDNRPKGSTQTKENSKRSKGDNNNKGNIASQSGKHGF
jgi:hypothetical protein